MMIRDGFVSNSSSTAFIIKNKTDEVKSLVDFVLENPKILDDYINEYGHDSGDKYYTQDNMVKCAIKRDENWAPGERKQVPYGDNDGDIIGQVYDYMLRGGGESDSFKWEFDEYWR